MEDSKYLINEDPIFFLPTLAVGVGLNEAILLQKIHGWLKCTPKEKVGRSWIYNSYKSWQEQLPFMSESTIKRAMKNLIDKGIVITDNFNKKSFDKTLWYSLDYKKLNSVVESVKIVENSDSVKMTSRLGQNDTTIVSKWTNYTNNNNNNNNNKKEIYKESFGTYKRIKLTTEEYTRLINEFGEDYIKKQIELLDEYIESNNNKNKYTNFNLVLRKSIRENWFTKKKVGNYETI